MIPSPIEDRRLAGIFLMLLAFLVFTGIDSCAKWLIQAGLPPLQVVFVRYAVHAVLICAVFLPREGAGLFTSSHPKVELARSAALLGSTIFNFLALQYLPLTLTSAIFFTVPLWICALSVPLLGEAVGPRRWTAVVIGFSGVLVATRPWGSDVHWAVLLSIAAALSASLYGILTRRLAGVDATATQQIYGAGVATLVIAPIGLSDWHWPVAGVDWAAFAMIGVLGFVGHWMLTVAHRFAAAAVLAPFVYVQIVYMTAASWAIFGQSPDIWVLAGAAIVLASGLYIWLRERQLARQARAQV